MKQIKCSEEDLNINKNNELTMRFIARVLFGFIGGALALFGFIFLFTAKEVITGIPNWLAGIIAIILAIVSVIYGIKGN